jgi:nitroreductase
METLNTRRQDYPVNPVFPQRWSPRALSGKEITEEELFSTFEAARWAPSSYNNQPWRFLYARRNTAAWDLFFNLLVEPNKVWCKNAAVLVVVISKTTFDHNGKPSKTHSYDTGAAWGYLALQGSMNNLVVHGMQGFDYAKAKEVLEIPDDYQVEAMAAIGRPGRKEDLPEEVQKREMPSDRKKISEISFEGKFQKK